MLWSGDSKIVEPGKSNLTTKRNMEPVDLYKQRSEKHIQEWILRALVPRTKERNFRTEGLTNVDA